MRRARAPACVIDSRSWASAPSGIGVATIVPAVFTWIMNTFGVVPAGASLACSINPGCAVVPLTLSAKPCLAPQREVAQIAGQRVADVRHRAASRAAAEACGEAAGPSAISSRNGVDQMLAEREQRHDWLVDDVDPEPNVAAGGAEVDIAVAAHRTRRRSAVPALRGCANCGRTSNSAGCRSALAIRVGSVGLHRLDVGHHLLDRDQAAHPA